MQIIKKIAAKSQNLRGNPIPTIAFIGDSVTQGCFEVFINEKGSFSTVYDREHAYHTYITKILSVLYPNVPINIINAGDDGGSATAGLHRLERDVLCHHPDLTVVSFGLNDVHHDLESYTKALEGIFLRLKEAGSEVIYMTENMMNTVMSVHLGKEEKVQVTAERTMKLQNEGKLKMFFEEGKEVARRCGVTVCDVHSLWETMAQNGVSTTDLLSNNINHPIREMNWLFAMELVKTMFLAD